MFCLIYDCLAINLKFPSLPVLAWKGRHIHPFLLPLVRPSMQARWFLSRINYLDVIRCSPLFLYILRVCYCCDIWELLDLGSVHKGSPNGAWHLQASHSTNFAWNVSKEKSNWKARLQFIQGSFRKKSYLLLFVWYIFKFVLVISFAHKISWSHHQYIIIQ